MSSQQGPPFEHIDSEDFDLNDSPFSDDANWFLEPEATANRPLPVPPTPRFHNIDDFDTDTYIEHEENLADYQLQRTFAHSEEPQSLRQQALAVDIPRGSVRRPHPLSQEVAYSPSPPTAPYNGCPGLTAVNRPTVSSPNQYTYLSSSSTPPARGSGKFMMANTTPSRTGVSPSSSPRLPSPPPFTEVQIGPKSPGVGEGGGEDQFGDAMRIDNGASRRIRPGTKAADMAMGPPLVPLNQLDSAFQLQEHVKALHWSYTHDPKSSTKHPITKQTALLLASPPQLEGDEPGAVDRHLWLYEICRFLVMGANNLIIAFFSESPPCSAASCPEMRASEWQYLCAVHDPPKSCCAIDYCCHTLDWAANILTSPKYFPSRLTLGGGEGNTNAGTSMRHLTNIFRRVYRIFAHAWFQHRAVFWQVEQEHGLYMFYKTVCDVYALIPEDNYTIPPEAEKGAAAFDGEDEEDEEKMETPIGPTSPEIGGQRGMQILRKEVAENGENGQEQAVGDATTTVSVGATTRRHKHTPSTGSHVGTIAEGQEDDDRSSIVTQLRDVHEEEPSFDIVSEEQEQGEEVTESIGKLDLSGESLTDIEAPEDPTPLAGSHTQDPFEEHSTTAEPDEAAEETELEDISKNVVQGSQHEMSTREAERVKTVEAENERGDEREIIE